jgi:hypothetical protein
MAVEIRELHIRAVVGTDTGDRTSSTTQRGHGVYSEEEQEALIALCVERVLEVLENAEER